MICTDSSVAIEPLALTESSLGSAIAGERNIETTTYLIMLSVIIQEILFALVVSLCSKKKETLLNT
jgi:hypothetical protein